MMFSAGTYRTHIVALALVALWSVSLVVVYLLVRSEPPPPSTVRIIPACVVDVAG